MPKAKILIKAGPVEGYLQVPQGSEDLFQKFLEGAIVAYYGKQTAPIIRSFLKFVMKELKK